MLNVTVCSTRTMQQETAKRKSTSLRSRLGLNHGWGFLKEKAEKAWLQGKLPGTGESVFLPHCWNSRDTFQVGLRYYQGHGSYRKHFELPEDFLQPECSFHLVSEGYYGLSEVWLNGKKLGTYDPQYIGLDLPLAGRHAPRTGDNLLAVCADNLYRNNVLPGKKMPDFLLHGGLAGRFFMERRPLVHLHEPAFRIRSRRPLAPRPDLEGSCLIRNHSVLPRSVRTTWTMTGPEGTFREIYQGPVYTLEPGAEQPVHFQINLDEVSLWSPSSPSLYRVTCSLTEGGRVIDETSRTYGFREIHFDGTYGFHLNGNHLYLHGVNRHECIPGLGNALSPVLHRRDAALIRELGFNLVRLAHYPQHPAFLDACDELGILVYAELATWKSVKRGRWLKAAQRQMEALVQRDRHHPSIILWGMGNESRSRKAYLELGETVRTLDPDRSTIYAENHLERGRRWRTLKLPDVLGVNYEITRLDEARERSRRGAVLVSECSNMPRSYRGAQAAELEQVMRYMQDLAVIQDSLHNAGYALWCFNDYPTQRKHRFQRHPGVVDAWRIPKPAAWYMKSRIDHKPFLHVEGSWSREDESRERDLFVFTNCQSVTLSLPSGWSLSLEGKGLHLPKVPFEPRDLACEGQLDGKITRTALHVFGPAYRLNLVPEQEAFGSEYETGSCLLEVLDQDGRVVTNWNGDVEVFLEGPGRLLLPFAGSQIPVRKGTGRLYFQSLGETGNLELGAVQHPLHAAELLLPVARQPSRPEI